MRLPRLRALARRALTPITPGAARSVVTLFALMLATGAANLLFTTGQVDRVAGVVHKQDVQAHVQAATIEKLNAAIAQLRAQQLAGCAFAADLGSVPIPDKPHPSKLGVSLVADSRAQWRELRCPGTLAPPSAGLVKWGRFYRIPVS